MSTFFISTNGSLNGTPGASIIEPSPHALSRRIILRRVSINILRVSAGDGAPISERLRAPLGVRSAASLHRSGGAPGSSIIAAASFAMAAHASVVETGDMLASMEMSVTAAPEMVASLARTHSNLSVRASTEAASSSKGGRKGKLGLHVASFSAPRGVKSGPNPPSSSGVRESTSLRVDDLAEAASEVIGCAAERGGGWRLAHSSRQLTPPSPPLPSLPVAHLPQ